MALTRRTWLFVPLILPVTGLAAVAAGAVTASLAPAGLKALLGWAVILVVIGLGLVWSRLAGARTQHRRVAAARAVWAQSRTDAELRADGAADERDAALLERPRWRVESARGRLRFTAGGVPMRAETWVLRARGRSRERREVVVAEAAVGERRMWLPLGASSALLLQPGWVGRSAAADEPWLAAVQELAEESRGAVSGLAIGDDRVMVVGADDPRIDTMLARADLVADVVRLIAGR